MDNCRETLSGKNFHNSRCSNGEHGVILAIIGAYEYK